MTPVDSTSSPLTRLPDLECCVLSLTQRLIAKLYGEQNRALTRQICDDEVSNENWYALALAYQSDQFMGWKVPITGVEEALAENNSGTSGRKARRADGSRGKSAKGRSARTG